MSIFCPVGGKFSNFFTRWRKNQQFLSPNGKKFPIFYAPLVKIFNFFLECPPSQNRHCIAMRIFSFYFAFYGMISLLKMHNGDNEEFFNLKNELSWKI